MESVLLPKMHHQKITPSIFQLQSNTNFNRQKNIKELTLTSSKKISIKKLKLNNR